MDDDVTRKTYVAFRTLMVLVDSRLADIEHRVGVKEMGVICLAAAPNIAGMPQSDHACIYVDVAVNFHQQNIDKSFLHRIGWW
jgi:hypothetical protein